MAADVAMVKGTGERLGMHFVLASGSLAKFWENPQIVPTPEDIPDLLTPGIRARLAEVEERRIEIQTHSELLGCDGLRILLSRSRDRDS